MVVVRSQPATRRARASFADVARKAGAWFEWYENKLTYGGAYTDGNGRRRFIYYDKSGNELGRFEIKDGTGTMLTFHPNRKPATKVHVLKGQLDGVYQELTPRGKVVVEARYLADRRHGWWREWTELPTGALQLMLEERWKNGKLDGAFKKYEAGKLAVETTYKNGKVDGAYTESPSCNGKPALTSPDSRADRREGTWTEYNPGGAVVMTATYKDGVLDGPWRQLIAGVVIEGTLVAGRRSGTWTSTDKTGASQAITYKTP